MAINWEAVRRSAKAPDDGAPGWPKGVRPISIDGLTLVGIDEHNRLYWDGKLIEISRTVTLNWWQTVLAALAAIGALMSGVAAIFPFVGIAP